jgi:hypothetical protein
LLLIGGGYFLIEVVEIGVIFGVKEGEVVGQGASDFTESLLDAWMRF